MISNFSNYNETWNSLLSEQKQAISIILELSFTHGHLIDKEDFDFYCGKYRVSNNMKKSALRELN